MANDLRTIELLIKAATDQGASQQTQAQLQAVAERLDTVGKSAVDAQGQIRGLSASMAALKENPEIVRAAEDLRQTAQAAQQANTELNKMTGQGTGGGGRFGGMAGPGGLGFSEFLGGMALRTMPKGDVGDVLTRSLLGAGSINSIISQIQMMSDKMQGGLGAALGSMLAALGPVTAAFLALNAVIALVGAANKDAAEKIKAQVEALHVFYKTIEEGTTATIEKAIADNQKAQREQKGVIADLDRQIVQAGRIRGGPASQGRSFEQGATVQQLTATRADEQKKLDALIDTEKSYLKAKDSEEVALRDAAIARGKAADAAIDEAAREEQVRRSGSSKGLLAEIANLTVRRDATAKELGDLNKRAVAGTAQPEDLAKQKEYIDNLNKLNSLLDADRALLPFVLAREREQKEIEDLLKAQEKRNQELAKERDQLDRINEQIAQENAAYEKKVKREDEDTATEAARQGITKDYQRRIQAAKDKEAEEDHQRQIQNRKDAEAMQERKLTEGYNRQKDKINAEFMDTELKAQQKFRDQEADDLAKFNKKYARALEDLQDKLTDAASRRDVAGFIQAQRDGEKQLRRMAEDFQDQDKERVAGYLKERQQARDNRAQQLAEAERAYREQLQAQRDQLADWLEQDRQAHQRRVLQSEILERQFQQLRDSWQVQDEIKRRGREEEDHKERLKTLHDQAMQLTAAIVSGMWDQLKSIVTGGGATTPGGFLANAVSAGTSVVNNAFGTIQAVIGGLGGVPATSVPGFTTIGAPLQRSVGRIRPQQFAGGLPYVPHDMYPAYLDYGERVLTRRENEAYSAGRTGGTTVNVYNSVGDIATKSMLDNYQVETVRSIRQAIQRRSG